MDDKKLKDTDYHSIDIFSKDAANNSKNLEFAVAGLNHRTYVVKFISQRILYKMMLD